MAAYADLGREELVARLIAYEGKGGPVGPPPTKPRKLQQPTSSFHFAGHPTRHVALLVSYQGWNYAGLALQTNTGYPTVESELLKALEKCRLIQAGAGWDAAEFARCGRTDRGVSGEGQVINLWLRSSRTPNDGGQDLGSAWRPPTEEKVKKPRKVTTTEGGSEGEKAEPTYKAPPVEIAYPRLLNAVLPPDIRVLAWSPVTPEFNSRFSCQYRHYKYAFLPAAIAGRSPLDVARMEEGAKLLVGEHDFRNLCKLDGSKQIENHSRRVIKAYIEPGPLPGHYVFNLIGTAFLWHQVRHIIAVLFLIGHGLEEPSLVSDLLDTTRFPAKPTYQMGHPIPLTLHECAYKPDDLDWRFGPYDGPYASLPEEQREAVRPQAELGLDHLERELEERRQEYEIRAWQVGAPLRKLRDVFGERPVSNAGPTMFTIGAGEHVQNQRYLPVTQRQVGDAPEVVNRKWRESKERKKAAEEKAQADAAAKAGPESQATA